MVFKSSALWEVAVNAGLLKLCSLIGLLWISCLPLTLAADEVVITSPSGKQTTRRGTIVELKGRVLTINSNGRDTKVPQDRIREMKTEYSAKQLDADRLFQVHRYDEAIPLYRDAFLAEERQWAKRLVLARVIECQANTQRLDQACKNFARLLENDPDTHLLPVMPLAWDTEQPPAALQRRVAPWLDDAEQHPALRLLAASWLLSGNSQELAMDALRQLGRSDNKAISKLAIAQMLRVELLTLKKARLGFWQSHVQSIPTELRAGPYYLLGRALAKHQLVDESAFAFLRLPALYPQQRGLVKKSVAACLQMFQRAGRSDGVDACDRLLQSLQPSVANN